MSLAIPTLSPAQRQELLRLARLTLEKVLRGEPEMDPDTDYAVSDPVLERPAGAFVTITRKGILRGCVGYSEPLFPLHLTVSRCVRSAATEDPRFPPVQSDGLPELCLSISLLSALRKVERFDEIEIGRDGLQVSSARHRGLLLPQVATEQGWDREQFLDGVCRKAGLPEGAWRGDGVEVFAFQAEVFSESS